MAFFRAKRVCPEPRTLGYAAAVFRANSMHMASWREGTTMLKRTCGLVAVAMFFGGLGLLDGMSGVAVGSVAHAQQPRVTILGADGQVASRIQGYLEGGLEGHVELVDVGPVGPEASARQLTGLAQRFNVQAYVSASTTKRGSFVTTVTVRQGLDGAVVAEETWREKRAPRLSSIERELWERIGSAIQDAQAPAPEEEDEENHDAAPGRVAAANEDEPSDEDEANDDAPSTSTRNALVTELSFGPMWRDQDYNDALREVPLRYYNEFGSPAMWVALSLEIYPLAFGGDGFLGDLGLVAGYGTAVGLDSSDEAGNTYSTSASAFHVGLRGRFSLGEGTEAGLTLAYGVRSFSTESPTLPLPEANHSFLRIAADGRMELMDGFGLELNAGYLLRLGTGELQDADYFPELSGGGVEAGIAAVIGLGSGLSVSANLDWQRFFFAFNPTLDADRVVGGATDDYYTFTLGARYAMGN